MIQVKAAWPPERDGTQQRRREWERDGDCFDRQEGYKSVFMRDCMSLSHTEHRFLTSFYTKPPRIRRSTDTYTGTRIILETI